jgi:hypothetical protein
LTTPQHKWPHQDEASLDAFYGDPHLVGDAVSARWAAENLVVWTPPYPLFYSDTRRSPLLHLKLHRLCEPTFTAAFQDVLDKLGIDYIQHNRLNISGGTFVPRLERGGENPSVHTWGCAIDMDPGHNRFPSHWQPGMIDPHFATILMQHGFTWRGVTGDDDPMHFQLCYRGR